MKKVALVASIIVIISLLVISLFTYSNLNKEFLISEEIIFEVKKGENNKNIFFRLEKQGLINFHKLHYSAFRVINLINPKLFFKSGEYRIPPNSDYKTTLRYRFSRSLPRVNGH